MNDRGQNMKSHAQKNKQVLPYVHEAERSDVWRVCVSDQTHQLFARQLESEQFVKKTESSRHNTASPNSTHLGGRKTRCQGHHCTSQLLYSSSLTLWQQYPDGLSQVVINHSHLAHVLSTSHQQNGT